MNRLELTLSHIQDARLKVFAHSSGDSDSVIPFDEGKRLTTILKALNAEAYSHEDFSADEKKWMVQNRVLSANRRRFLSDMQKNIGQVLYETLFPERTATEKTLSGLTYGDADLHIQIEVKGNVGKQRLLDYPWELLCHNRAFLVEKGIHISRYIAIEENSPPNLPSLKRINVLLLSSRAFDPKNDLIPLSDEEQKAVYRGLKKAKEGEADGVNNDENIHIVQLRQPVTYRKLQDYLAKHMGEETPHIIHFDGHGHFGSLCQCKTFNPGIAEKCNNKQCSAPLFDHQGYLLFEDGSGNPDYISAQNFASLLGNANRSNKTDQGITLVVLSACKSSLALAENSVFNGVAQRLIYQRIPAVVGMAFTVRADSASVFTEQFYRAIRQKLPLVQAMTWGRQAMRFEDNQWYRPVLYMRWQDNEGGQIFAKQSESDQVARNIERQQTIKQTDRSRRRKRQPVSPVTPELGIQLKSSSTVLASAIEYYEEIKQKQIQLLPVYLLFGLDTVEEIPSEHYELVARSPLFSIEDIWPEHCELAIISLQDITQPVQEFYDLVSDALTRERTIEVVQLQSSLTIPLRMSCELLRKLISLISEFEEVCQTSTGDMIEQRREIMDNLKKLKGKLYQVNTTMDAYSK